MQASALADLTAAVSEMCYCGAGMNHLEPFSVVRGITQNCIALRKSLQGMIWVPLCRQTGVCVVEQEQRGSCVSDINGPVKVPANIFI